jgi:hypothetical protein
VPREGTAAVSVGNLVIFAGGNHGSILSDVIDIYNVNTGKWSVAKLSSPRKYITAVSAGNKILFGGGEKSLNSSDVTATVDIFQAE